MKSISEQLNETAKALDNERRLNKLLKKQIEQQKNYIENLKAARV